jgi:hypothetical protein
MRHIREEREDEARAWRMYEAREGRMEGGGEREDDAHGVMRREGTWGEGRLRHIG